MGVPKFFRFISERYPCILEIIKDNTVQEIDNLYLDMNGIFHTCSHSNDQDVILDMSEEQIFNNIFHYIDVLFHVIRPKKLLFLAVDGVAPRAKMNQQRSRRFRVAKDRELQEKKMKSEGKQPSDTPRFDSNCITPGTEFMVKLQAQLEYYVASRITTNPLWRTCKVILSGHQVPGEGEHKIVEYIRYMKSLPDYDSNLRHCLYGLDADLVMLGLCTHEKNFSILREEVVFGRKSGHVLPPEQTKFYLLHLGLLKEYLDLEFKHLKNILPFEYDLESIIDDWVLMGFILGNDFIPHLPDFHIAKGALPVLYSAYSEVLPKLGGYLNEGGHLNLPRFQAFMEALAKHELKTFEETYADLQYFAEKTGQKFNSEKSKDSCDEPKNSELENLLGDFDDLNFSQGEILDLIRDLFSDPEKDEDEEEMFLQEFHQHKRDYYLKKLEYPEVTDEVLRSQAEGYVRGLQWILHYYYHGCPSWSWFYPHHYAPCTSDIVNFKSVNLDFELGEPFLPYQQLLAVLPPGSKNLLPKVYQSLMTSQDSPLIEYYPSDFETDLNGKQHEWEAIVLLPIIDEDNLLTAMKECDGNLTQEEKRNNKHGPMLFYSYTSESLGKYNAPQYFPDIESNHALIERVWRDQLKTASTNMRIKSTGKENSDVYFPGFPTFKYVQFEAAKKKARLRIFNYATTSASIILTITQGESFETEAVAADLLDSIVCVRWPYLTEARIVAVADAEFLYSLNGKELKKEKHSGTEKLDWSNSVSSQSRHYAEKLGINIGTVKVLVYAKLLKGKIFSPGNKKQLNCVKVWSEGVEMYPLQTVVKDVKIFESSVPNDKPDEIFSIGSVVFTLTPTYYGSMGKIVKHMEQSSDRVKIELEVRAEPNIDRKLLNRSNISYHTAYVAGQLIGTSQSIVSRISGSILVDVSNPEQMSSRKSFVNIGLGMKFNKYQEEIPGYTKKDNYWLYSDRAVDVMKEYVTAYPNVIKYLSTRTKDSYVPRREEIFPDPDGVEEIHKLVDWISNLECSKIKPVPSGSKILEKDVILKLEDVIDNSPKDFYVAWTIAKFDQLFKSELVTNSLPPVQEAEHRLLDRVIATKPNHTVPQGLRGYIIGIHNAQKPQDVMYDILYDTPFPSGMALNCSPGRGFKTNETSFINISYGERLHQLNKPRKTNRNPSATLNPSRILVRESPPSAFAQWNLCSPVLPAPDKEIPYRGMWSLLEKDKSQDETKILKKMLRIEEDQNPKIEENVKNFFESLSKNSENLMLNVNSAVKMPTPHRQPGPKVNVLNYFKSRNMPPPNFVFNKDGRGHIICKIQLQNQKEFTGLPCSDEGTALESASELVLSYFASINKNADSAWGKNQKILESQEKLQRSLFKDSEPCQIARNPESVKSVVKLRGTNDKLNRGNKPLVQGQRRNNVPKVLPTPPQQWYRQGKNSHLEEERHYHSEEHKQRPGAWRIENSSRQRFYNENHNNWDRSRMDMSFNQTRNPTWRQQDDKAKTMQSDVRLGNEPYYPGVNYAHWRQRPIQGYENHSGSQNVFLRPDIYHLKQENGHSRPYPPNFEVGNNNSSQKLSAIATEFIPLQALTRNRRRKPTPAASTAAPVQSTAVRKETKQEEMATMPAVVQTAVESPKERHSPSYRSRRKSKIAAKFDGAWDLQG